jgi:hypothetical protein
MNTITSLYYEASTRIDAQEAIRQLKIGDSWRLVRLAAVNICFSEADGYVQFDAKITNKKLRVVIKLLSDDTYAVEIGRMKRSLDYVVLDQVRGIYTDQLGETVERMCVEQS